MWLFRYLKSIGKNFGYVTSSLYRGALPKKEDYRELKALGITLVINLIDDLQIEQACDATRAGLNWVHIPMSDKHAPTKGQIEDVIKQLRFIRTNINQVGFVHCKGGRHRTSLVVAIYRVLFSGWSKEQAWDEARKYGWYGALGHEPLKTWFFKEFNPEEYK